MISAASVSSRSIACFTKILKLEVQRSKITLTSPEICLVQEYLEQLLRVSTLHNLARLLVATLLVRNAGLEEKANYEIAQFENLQHFSKYSLKYLDSIQWEKVQCEGSGSARAPKY